MLPRESSPRKRPYVLLPAALEPVSDWPADASAQPRFAVRLAWRELDAATALEATPLTIPDSLPELEDVAPVEVAPVLEPQISVPTPELEDLPTEPISSETFGDTASATPSTPRRPTLHELAVAVVPSLVGAGLAWFVSGETSADPVTWTALGAAAGFLLGWGCLLWIRRED
jgi:hypothetical protein